MVTKFLKILAFALFLFITLTPADTNAKSSFYFSLHFHDKNKETYIYVASGGVIAVGVTLGFFYGGYYSSKERGGGAPMYASLFTFDMKKQGYKFSVPEISLDEDSFYVPLFQWNF
jgi:hypothetical protein